MKNGNVLKEEKSRKMDLCVMRILATIAVVFLHTCNTLSNNIETFSLSKRQYLFFSTGNFWMNWAVPIFLMIMGTLLLESEKHIDYNVCIRKYAKRMLLALFVFGIPFSLLEIFMNTKRIYFSIVFESIFCVLAGDSWDHLWYLYSLIGLYLILPVLKAFTDKCSRNEQVILLEVLFGFNFCIPIVKDIFSINIAFTVPFMSFTVFYVLLGKLLYDDIPRLLRNKKLDIIIVVVIFIAIALINMVAYPNGEKYLGYDSPLIVLLSMAFFSLIKGVNLHDSFLLWRIDRLCFGVYLIHPLFINFVYKYLEVTPISFRSYHMATIVFTIGYVIIAFITSWFMACIKPLKKYIL